MGYVFLRASSLVKGQTSEHICQNLKNRQTTKCEVNVLLKCLGGRRPVVFSQRQLSFPSWKQTGWNKDECFVELTITLGRSGGMTILLLLFILYFLVCATTVV